MEDDVTLKKQVEGFLQKKHASKDKAGNYKEIGKGETVEIIVNVWQIVWSENLQPI